MANTEITGFHGTLVGSRTPAELLDRAGELKALWSLWRERRRYRADLKRLLKVGPHMIADIGLALETARLESRKPFWRD
jgi:uncharacterized protein YjiS (DUF1127 family)